MAAEPEQEEPREDSEALYWADTFRQLGMDYPQALTLAYDQAVDRHEVRVALEQGCRPELAFLIYSS